MSTQGLTKRLVTPDVHKSITLILTEFFGPQICIKYFEVVKEA